MFEEQYRELWDSIDDIAERIRTLDAYAPGTMSKFQGLADVKETDSIPSATGMLQELVSDNEAVVRTLRAALSTVQSAGDEASAGLLADRITYHEKQIWMMKSTLKT
jgi:starvation-inducible DNA-binding protein